MEYEKIQPDLKDLNPKVKRKALEIANRLMEEENLSEGEAIRLAIKKAEEWYLDTQG